MYKLSTSNQTCNLLPCFWLFRDRDCTVWTWHCDWVEVTACSTDRSSDIPHIKPGGSGTSTYRLESTCTSRYNYTSYNRSQLPWHLQAQSVLTPSPQRNQYLNLSELAVIWSGRCTAYHPLLWLSRQKSLNSRGVLDLLSVVVIRPFSVDESALCLHWVLPHYRQAMCLCFPWHASLHANLLSGVLPWRRVITMATRPITWCTPNGNWTLQFLISSRSCWMGVVSRTGSQ